MRRPRIHRLAATSDKNGHAVHLASPEGVYEARRWQLDADWLHDVASSAGMRLVVKSRTLVEPPAGGVHTFPGSLLSWEPFRKACRLLSVGPGAKPGSCRPDACKPPR
jgi:hypothetical protein